MVSLVVIAGPANSGKLPLAKHLLKKNPDLLLVHRDTIRESLVNQLDEALISWLMYSMADYLLSAGRSVVICAWNLEQFDRDLWLGLSVKREARLIWLDTREEEVKKLIPPVR
jgi:predicted kinase